MEEQVRLGKWSVAEIDEMLTTSAAMNDPSQRVEFISRQFLGVPYQPLTLVGSPQTPEILVINLEAVDCFTFIDYVEAMRFSSSFLEFRGHLKRVRYRSSRVAYGTRRHFFTDWLSVRRIEDITSFIGQGREITVQKMLNVRNDRSCFLPGIPPVARKIRYLPAKDIGGPELAAMKSGDYMGIYTDIGGLDVSHVGIFVRNRNRISFRHASLNEKQVVDQDFRDYLLSIPGVLVFRAR
jgi:hypothetical protein